MNFGMKLATATVFAALAVGGLALAEDAEGVKRTLLQRQDVNDKQEVVMGMAEIAKGASAGRHTHFGTESSYVMEGEVELIVEGEPARKFHAGQAFQVPTGKIHDANSIGAVPAKLIAVYVVEKGKPLATPAK